MGAVRWDTDADVAKQSDRQLSAEMLAELLEAALGRPVDVAINHDAVALALLPLGLGWALSRMLGHVLTEVGTAVLMGFVFGLVFGLLDVEDEQIGHLRVGHPLEGGRIEVVGLGLRLERDPQRVPHRKRPGMRLVLGRLDFDDIGPPVGKKPAGPAPAPAPAA